MSTVTFDTLEMVHKLRTSGLPLEQAEAIVRAIAEAQSALVTKADRQIAFAAIHDDLRVIKWMIGALIALEVVTFAKQFF